MRHCETKARLLRGEAALGVGLGLGSPLAAEMLSTTGFDFALVDYQHGNWDDASALLAFRGLLLGQAEPMVRVRQNDYYAIGRALDRGALGIVVPLVNSPAEAREAARAVRYPPRGERSMGPFAAGVLGPNYAAEVDAQVLLMVQIESRQAAAQARAILAVEGVDGCWVGPTDLALSMGLDLSTPAGRQAHEAAILGVLAACRQTNKIPGIAATPANAQHWLDQGFRFVTVASDTTFLASGAAEILGRLRR
jgi:4-hydroxy-2-oxoheptanedioate aldolase